MVERPGENDPLMPIKGHVKGHEEASELSFAPHAPKHLQTERGRWIALGITAAMCAVASGPVGAWPTLEPLLINAGVFAGGGHADPAATLLAQQTALDVCASLAIAVQMASILPAGFLYDRVGGRECAVYGAAIASVGLGTMGIACHFPENFSWLLYVGYALAQVGGSINTQGVMTFIWLMPAHPNFISSTAAGVTSLSDMFSLVAVGLDSCCGLFIGNFFIFLAGACFVAGAVCWCVVPSRAVMLRFAAETAGASQEEEDLGPFPKGEVTLVKRSWAVMSAYPVANGILLAFSTAYMLSIIYPMQQMLFYYKVLFSDKVATELVDVYAFLYGIGGFGSALFGGLACDKLGLRNFTIALVACSVLLAIFLPIATAAAQTAAQMVMVVGMSLYMIIINRFSMLYAPPELFGTLGGVQFSIISVGMLVGVSLVSLGTKDLKGAAQYQVPFVALGVVSSILGGTLAYHWTTTPPPPMGGVEFLAMREEQEASRGVAKRGGASLSGAV